MRTRLVLLLLFVMSLASCGGMDTIVTVYPDGRADLTYHISAPAGKMPDLESMGKGDLSELFKKDQFLSQDPGKLIDSLVQFGIDPLLRRLKSNGKIRDFSIIDSQQNDLKGIQVAIHLASYQDVGPIHSAFKREIPALDSIFRKLTNKPSWQPNDSIAIVSLGDSLEMQLHHFMIEPQLVTMTREERIANGRRMFDSLVNMFTDPESIFSAMMSEEERAQFQDSINFAKANMTEDMLDSIGRAYEMFGDGASREIFKPKIALRAPLMLSTNEDELPGRIGVSMKNGMTQFEPSTPYGEVQPSTQPFRQRFRLTMPAMQSFSQEERDEWRNILRWCDECESGFLSNPSKQRKPNITFHPAVNGWQLIEVDCGLMNAEKVRAYYTMRTVDGMPTVGVHQFTQGFYMDDPVSELRQGSPRFVTRKTDLLVGKINYDPKTQTISVDRSTAKEVFDLSNGAPEYRSGSYKDKAGKWIKMEGYINNSTDPFDYSRYSEGTMTSTEMTSGQSTASSGGWD